VFLLRWMCTNSDKYTKVSLPHRHPGKWYTILLGVTVSPVSGSPL
jgi:hypothetical protein